MNTKSYILAFLGALTIGALPTSKTATVIIAIVCTMCAILVWTRIRAIEKGTSGAVVLTEAYHEKH